MVEIAKVSIKNPEAKRENKASQTPEICPSQSISSPAEQILLLQRTIGNQAVQKLIRSRALQAKLRIGQPGDKYEQEADRVAEQVMRMPEISKDTKAFNHTQGSSIQRRCPGCKKGTKIEKDEEEEKLQKKEASSLTHEVTPELESSISAVRGGGQLLPESVSAFFEPRFGTDFSQVRVHSGASAEQSARDVNAKAYTMGHDIVFGAGQFAPQTSEGKRLLAHELTHVVQQSVSDGNHVGEKCGLPPIATQQSGTARIIAGGSKENSSSLQRTPEQAQALTSRYTSWGNLNESALGHELLRLALGGQFTFADEVLTALGSTDRDDVSYEFMLAANDSQLAGFAATTEGRQFLDRLFDELTSGSVAAEEQQQADRILQVKTRSTVSVAAFDTAATSRRTKVFPFRLPGFTVLSDAPIEARRERSGVWVHTFVRVLGTGEFHAETATLPTEYFLNGIVLPENEVIGVRLYDQGGIIHYTTPLFLIQLANATDQQVLEKIIEAAGIGLTLGTGALAGLGVEASMTARVLLWADRAAFVLGTVTSVLREHRSWLVGQFGPGFMDAVDILHSAAAIYGIARVALEAPRIILGLRNSYRAFSEAARSRSSGFSSAEQATIQQVTRSTDDLIEQVDNIQGARSTPQTGPQRAAGTAPRTESTTGSPSAHTEPVPGGTRRTPETPPERIPSEPEAPAAAAAGASGTYRPTPAELESYADRAWRVLGGRGPRPAVTETPLPSGTSGQYGSSPRTIEVGTGASSPGSVIDTVWHEASHGRIRELVGFMNEHLGGSWQRTLLRPLDEIVSYFIGGLGRVIQGPTVSSRLFGILEMLGAPISAIGSMANTAERALWAAHMVALAAALIWAEIKILMAIRERHDSGTPQPAPAP